MQQKYNTPIQQAELELTQGPVTILIKREDLCPSGSFKDRLVGDIWENISTSNKEVVVHSSGNFAISCLYHAVLNPNSTKLKVFINDKLPTEKRNYLDELAVKAHAEILESQRPKSDAIQYANSAGAFLFRGSTNPTYPDSYVSLAAEIIEARDDIDAIIIPTSSATAAVGVMRHLKSIDKLIPVYIVQTSYINAIAREFDNDFTSEGDSMANAISDRVAKRKTECSQLLRELNGGGVVIDSNQLATAVVLLNSDQMRVQEILPRAPYSRFTANAALSIAGFSKLLAKGYNFNNPLLILSGN